MQPGDIYLGYADTENGLGKEGYTVTISDTCVIEAEQVTGIRWGTVTVLQLLEQGTELPQGEVRDYPKYEVRGFGIDVARKAVSMNTLYAMLASRYDKGTPDYINCPMEKDEYLAFWEALMKWPRNGDEVRLLSHQQLRWLLEGLSPDQPNAVQKWKPPS